MAQQERFDWWVGGPAPRAARAERAERAARRVPAPRTAERTRGGEVYRAVQAGDAFQEIRRDYRRFTFPAVGAFLTWYLLFVTAQAFAPQLMARKVVGPVNLAWLLGLLQFASTFLLTWLYARNARTKRDRAALELRWDTQDQLR